MTYSAEQISLMARLHAMLESDTVEDPDSFTKVFVVVHEHIGIPSLMTAEHLSVDEGQLVDWSEGRNLPSEPEWPEIIDKIMQLLLHTWREHRHRK